jgi:4-amino-4-deoxy-L-arabinose transferase-like glycosyltransferase
MAMLLFTGIIASTLYFTLKPNVKRAIVLGVVLGLSSLSKSTFLPYVFLAPFLMWMLKRERGRLGLAIVSMLCAVLVIAPWTIRNWKLTGKFIPVHTRIGYNLEIGDEIVEHIRESPFAMYRMWYTVSETVEAKTNAIPRNLDRWQRELMLDSELMKVSLDRYRENPAFLAKKIVVNAWLFWTLGVTESKTVVVGSMMLPLVLLTIVSGIIMRRRGQMRTIMGVHVSFILFYYLMHLPVEAIARYSVILVPAMIMYGLGPIAKARLDRRSETDAVSRSTAREEPE